MKILIIEDEPMIARRIIRMTRAFYEQELETLTHCDTLLKGQDFIHRHEIDLLLLDLNLHGEDGFKLLQSLLAQSFHTIIISAYKEKAITAFEYGVLDFVPKPFNEERLHQAFSRMNQQIANQQSALKYLAIQQRGGQQLIDISSIIYIKGARIYTELHLKNQKTVLHNKSLDKLEQLLPASFERIHKSYLVDMHQATEVLISSGGKYELLLQNQEQVPISRSKYKKLKEKWFV